MGRRACLVIVFLVGLSLMFFTSSCAQKEIQTQVTPSPEPEVQKSPEIPAEEAQQDNQLMEQLRTEEAARETAFISENVHFAFDSAALSDQARQTLSSMVDYLRTNSDVTVTVEGHCDDRGSDSYNMALGEKRAESVKKFLVDMGIGIDRLKTVSYGEQRPIAKEENETAWAQNRRAQFVID